MSASNEWFEYHLTYDGWVQGSEKTDFGSTDRPKPANTVLTRTYKEFMASPFSGLERTFSEYVVENDLPLLRSMLQKYGRHPIDLYNEYVGSSIA